MKILLDECLPLDFRHSFSNHEAHSTEWVGFKGKKNGELLQAAEAAGYVALPRSTREYLTSGYPLSGSSQSF